MSQETKTLIGSFDPFAALKYNHDIKHEMREMIQESIELIDDDRPNAAKRLLVSILTFGPEKRLRERTEGMDE